MADILRMFKTILMKQRLMERNHKIYADCTL